MTARYQLKTDTSPMLIDNEPQPRGQRWLGIAKRKGKELTICLAPDKRPTEFWPEYGSTRELIVLRRTGPVKLHPDEKAIRGKWYVVRSDTSLIGPEWSWKPAGWPSRISTAR